MTDSEFCRTPVALVLALFLGCRGAPAPPPPASPAITPPVFYDDGAAAEEVFLGKTMAEIRQMLRVHVVAGVALLRAVLGLAHGGGGFRRVGTEVVSGGVHDVEIERGESRPPGRRRHTGRRARSRR